MRAYLAITTLLLIGIYGAGYAWPDTAEYIAAKCEASDGDYLVWIDGDQYACFKP